MSASSASDNEDELLNFQYIPKAERDRQRHQKEDAGFAQSDDKNGKGDDDADDRHDKRGDAAHHMTRRKRPRTVYEQERDAKVRAVLASTGAGTLLAHVHQLEQQEKVEAEAALAQMRWQSHPSHTGDDDDDDGHHGHHPHHYIRDHASPISAGPRHAPHTRQEHVTVSEWHQQEAARQARRLLQGSPDTMGGRGRGGRGGGYRAWSGTAERRPQGMFPPSMRRAADGRRDEGRGQGLYRGRGRQ